VTNRGNFGVFLDIGAVKDGRLRVPAKFARQMRVGDQVEGMVIESLDAETEQITLSLPYELSLATQDDGVEEAAAAPPKSKPKPKAKSKAAATQALPNNRTGASGKRQAKPIPAKAKAARKS